MFMKNRLIKMGILASSVTIIAACSNEETSEENHLVDGEELTLATGPWESENASTAVIAQVLESVGYDTTTTTLDAAVIWEALASGDADAQVGAWLPQTSAPYVEEYGDQVEYLGVNLEGAALGLAVPTYMDVDSIADLTDEANQEITGIEAGASVVAGAQEVTEVYDNMEGWTVVTSSTGAMATALDDAYNNQEEIVVTGWSPHWKFQRFDLKYLDDPEGVFGDEEYIGTVARLGLDEEHPVAHHILENFYWEVEDMETVMLEVQEGASAEEAAQNWIEDNAETVQSWIDGAEQYVENVE